MSKVKAQPFMTVTMSVSKQDLEYAAECVTDELFDHFDYQVFEMLGLTSKGLREELLTFEPFLEAAKEAVARAGLEALEDPYAYIDFDDIYDSKEWRSLFNVCEELQETLNEIEHEERNQRGNPCEEAIKTLQLAGFKIVKA